MSSLSRRSDFHGIKFVIGEARDLGGFLKPVDCFVCSMFNSLIIVTDEDVKFGNQLSDYLFDKFLWFNNFGEPEIVTLTKRWDGLYSYEFEKDTYHHIKTSIIADNSYKSKVLLIDLIGEDSFDVMMNIIENRVNRITKESMRRIKEIKKQTQIDLQDKQQKTLEKQD